MDLKYTYQTYFRARHRDRQVLGANVTSGISVFVVIRRDCVNVKETFFFALPELFRGGRNRATCGKVYGF